MTAAVTSPPRWAPRLPKEKLRALYASEAGGHLDEALLQDVAATLFLRCRDIVRVARAKRGRLTCPECEIEFDRRRDPKTGSLLDSRQTCPQCGWSLLWRDFIKSIQRRQLNAGGAAAAFEAYLQRYRAARRPAELLLAVDRLIHEFHYSLKQDPSLPTRPAAVNLLNGQLRDILPFLDALSGNLPRAGEREAVRQRWTAARQRYRTVASDYGGPDAP